MVGRGREYVLVGLVMGWSGCMGGVGGGDGGGDEEGGKEGW